METSASINSKDQIKEFLIEIMEHVEPDAVDSILGCIYRVPEDIRRTNKDAYTPKLISIGPLHHGREKLADIEKRKKRYLKSFFDRLPPEKVAEKRDEIITFVKDYEQTIRAYYAEAIELESPQFVTMIICDAIFIIEHFLRTCSDDGTRFSGRSNELLNKPQVQSTVSLDLILLENQLPYFILMEIYNLVFGVESKFMEISIRFFTNAFNLDAQYLDFQDHNNQPVVKHFTDLVRTALVKSCPNVNIKGPIRDLPCAMKLHESGVQFRSATGGSGLFDIRLKERKRLVPCWKVKELHIPCFAVYDSTEYLLRNLVALEQFHYPSDTRVCNYVRFMDYLINTEKDVELLVAGGIICDVVGNNAQIANMFNNLGIHVIPDDNSCYYLDCKELKAHYQNPLNKKKASLENVYFRDLWTGTATILAGILLLLTAIQTICSIMQVT